ncbi:MAG: biotin/lipoyl-containing protein [Candidatus Acidiferrales bacterium]
MATEFKLPELGENVESGDVTKVLVAPGDSIAKDQAVVELETEKATIEVPSPTAGTVKQVHVKQGQKVKVGELILTIDDGAAPAEKKEAKPEAKKKEEKGEPRPAEKKEAKASAVAPEAQGPEGPAKAKVAEPEA